MEQSPIHSPAPKKRKLRKGTHSCWECKRRKAKCVFTDSEDSVCVGCRNRGTVCVGQDEKALWVDQEGGGETKVANKRLERVEFMLETLLKDRGLLPKTSGNTERLLPELPNEVPSTNPVSDEAHNTSKIRDTNPTLSQTLYALLPSSQECLAVCEKAEFIPCFFQQLLNRNFLDVCNTFPELVLTKSKMAVFPAPNAHPIVLAQRLLILACISQISQYSSEDHSQLAGQWKKRAQTMTDTVIDLVTSKDHFVRNAEGLECLMLEATYHSNSGNIRRAFTTIRRAMALAQLFGIHRTEYQCPQQIDSQAPKFDAAYTWYRIVYLDRLYCLILGLPQGSSDIKFLNPPKKLKINFEEHLERQHCIIAAKILERNEVEPQNACVLTGEIDKMLQSAATIPPSEWWLLPTFSTSLSQSQRFLATGRLAMQLFHFNLINQTHLPYIFHNIHHNDGSSSPVPTTATTPTHECSKNACATASREILSRYLLIRESSLVVHAYTFLDFFTLIAAMTLLVLHIDNHWLHRASQSPHSRPSPHILSHMRPSDRAMLERLAHHMSLKDTSTTSKGFKVLQELLAVEDETFRYGSVGSGVIVKDESEVDANAKERFFEIRMPWYGWLRLSARKTCFKRIPEVDEVRTSIGEMETLVNGSGENSVGDGAQVGGEALFGDWFNAGFGLHSGFDEQDEGDFRGIETAFFDSLVANVGSGSTIVYGIQNFVTTHSRQIKAHEDESGASDDIAINIKEVKNPSEKLS
ncbi:hypothetical protein DM02DRAFT_669564 [Periconia macrospinosa]|uniref:Zn(2)-C6 fungal-type domain-containing protein n=1 Tax=Periconia macrospinosa TaxID=97972 RepID=A0A2V1E0M7_9PLEO|nr:hypothetical protein DM02DRAFT_669564 [Periconia macrospinosa]